VNLLDRLIARWRRRWTLSVALTGVATGLLTAVVARRVLGATPTLGIAAGAALALVLVLRRKRVDRLAMARHLNRTVPALEESADLLLRSADTLSPIQQMQRARLERTLGGLAPDPALPDRGLRLSAGFASVALLGSLGLLAIAPRGEARSMAGPAAGPMAGAAAIPPAVSDVQITVTPPAYTGKAQRRTDGWDLEVEQGARVTWRLRTTRPVNRIRLVTTSGDSSEGRRRSDREFEVALPAERSSLYQISLRDGGTAVSSDYHRLTVIPDAPPIVTVVRPEPRTEIAFGSSVVVPLEVLVSDDYGIADARIVATLTTGAGEAVKFREQTLDFETRTPRGASPTSMILRRPLNPSALAMQPGDELYFYVQVHDNRHPEPNESRSETFFVSLADTAQVVLADWSGLAVNALPEYLRSQRQIIIDTETLLAQAASLAPQTVHDRSNNIGIDQHLLRERYGEIIGQENVVAGTEPTIEHEHDTPESATLLAETVKDTLQAAVAQMWEAELRLRTYEPRAALPFEYRALELLKVAQQAARIYVKRVGFEPPPLEPDRKRLTGTLTAIGNPTSRREVVATASMATVRVALAVVQRLRAGGQREPGDADALERAGRELARLAIAQPGAYLETLRDLRMLIDARARATDCGDCLPRLERGLWAALPAADPDRGSRTEAITGVVRDYFDRLQRAGRP
jgi:hypothetical protein